MELEDLDSEEGYKLYLGQREIHMPKSIPREHILKLFSPEALRVLKSKLTFDDISKIREEVKDSELNHCSIEDVFARFSLLASKAEERPLVSKRSCNPMAILKQLVVSKEASMPHVKISDYSHQLALLQKQKYL
jgi:hypothetical protein